MKKTEEESTGGTNNVRPTVFMTCADERHGGRDFCRDCDLYDGGRVNVSYMAWADDAAEASRDIGCKVRLAKDRRARVGGKR